VVFNMKSHIFSENQ